MGRKAGRSRSYGRRRNKKGGIIKKIIIFILIVLVVVAVGIFALSSLKKNKANEPNNTVTVNENTVVDTHED